MGNLSDKIIDDQGNARTYSSGYDSRLHYINVNGQDKKYLLEGDVPSGNIDIKEMSIVDTDDCVECLKRELKFELRNNNYGDLECELFVIVTKHEDTTDDDSPIIEEKISIWKATVSAAGWPEFTTINDGGGEQEPQNEE